MTESKVTDAAVSNNEWRPIGDYPWGDVPKDVRLIVSYAERPFEHLYLHSQVAFFGSHDLDWTSVSSGEPISRPTHWMPYMSLEEAKELGETDSEANWDNPVRMEAHRIRRDAALTLLSQPVSGELPQAWITCPSCDGTRMDLWGGTEHDCTVCNARGVVPFVSQSPPSGERAIDGLGDELLGCIEMLDRAEPNVEYVKATLYRIGKYLTSEVKP